jgi:hypothetical protein
MAKSPLPCVLVAVPEWPQWGMRNGIRREHIRAWPPAGVPLRSGNGRIVEQTMNIVKPAVQWLFLDLNAFLRRASSRRPEPYAVLPYQDRYVLREARRLCPAVISVEANHRLYTDYHERILAAVDTCLPDEKVMSIDETGGLGST